VIGVPSEQQPADRGGRPDRGEKYDIDAMIADIGEDPGRWLDRDLFGHGLRRLEDREPDFEKGDQRLVRDSNVSAPGQMIRDRISGIDKIAVARAWIAVERRLPRTPDGGRDVVIGLLDDRINELEAEGERDLPGRSGEELKELGVEKFEAVAPKEDVVFRGPDGEPTGRGEGSTANQKLAAMADGGEE
jgi:hypothetical protein